ncbi:hypothetical protein B0H34DRAFT_670879 [Crassisporium funariophilum]|nr:hypothetical protein B0H34DRAFT_670879 [Crassisporium funariophilum]
MQDFTAYLLLLIVLLVQQPAAVYARSAARALSPRTIGKLDVSGLLRLRQTPNHNNIPDLPAECRLLCNPVNAILNAGSCSPDVCCLAGFEKSYFDCFGCIAEVTNVTDLTYPQQLVDTLVSTCASMGMSIPILTYPGQNPDRPVAHVTSSSITGSSGATQSPMNPTVVVTPTTPQKTPLNIPLITAVAQPGTTTGNGTSSPAAVVQTQTTSAQTGSAAGRRAGGRFSSGIAVMFILGTWFLCP